MSIQMEDSWSIIFFKMPKRNLEESSYFSFESRKRAELLRDQRRKPHRESEFREDLLLCRKPPNQGSTAEAEPVGEIHSKDLLQGVAYVIMPAC